MSEEAEVPSTSPDPVSDNIEKLKGLFPEAVTEDGIDADVLLQLLGEDVAEGDEKYGLNWHGKKKARQLALTPSAGTLRPCPEDSVDWDNTKNLVIEGDNLEVLKLLQKSYAGKVKLIYIDPPYNTGKDFVYPDNFKDSIGNYLSLTGQVDEEGNKMSSNTESSGRFHTDWLNMMYPRLKLARELLREDGVILSSIDYHEAFHLRELMNEVFGESNFVGEIYWESKTKSQNTETSYNKLQPKAEVLLVYTRGEKRRFNLVSKGSREYGERDDRGPYRLAAVEQMDSGGVRGRTTMVFPILGIEPRAGNQWKVGQETITEYLERDDLVELDGKPTMKIRPEDERTEVTEPFWGLFGKEIGTAETAKKELTGLMNRHGFDTVKPVDLLSRLVFHVTSRDDAVLDFFAGSGTTGHAVMAQNAADGGKRRYILVQLPEPLDPGNKDQKVAAEYCDELGKPRTIAELTKERLRRAAKKVKEDNPDFEGDLGFRAFKLDSSNIRSWDPQPENLERKIEDSVITLKNDRDEKDVLYEVLLKLGLDLCVPIETKEISGTEVHSIGAGTLFACLAEELDAEVVEELAQKIVSWRDEIDPAGETTCLFRDSAFPGNVAKTNLNAILEQGGIETVRSI